MKREADVPPIQPKIEAASFAETWVLVHRTTRHRVAAYRNFSKSDLINGYCFSTYVQLHCYYWCMIVNACGHHLVMPAPVATNLLCPYLWPPFSYASTFGHHLAVHGIEAL